MLSTRKYTDYQEYRDADGINTVLLQALLSPAAGPGRNTFCLKLMGAAKLRVIVLQLD